MGVTLVSREEVLQTFERSDLKKDIEELRDALIFNTMEDGDPPPAATELHSLIDLKIFWDDAIAWRKDKDGDIDDWNSDEEEEEEKPLDIVGNEVPCLPLYEKDSKYRQVVDNSELDDFWNTPGANKMCLVPESLFEDYFRVRQLDVSQTVLDQMCSPLTDSPDLLNGLKTMANITSISGVLDNSDLRALIENHLLKKR
jgi:hypothetical protein